MIISTTGHNIKNPTFISSALIPVMQNFQDFGCYSLSGLLTSFTIKRFFFSFLNNHFITYSLNKIPGMIYSAFSLDPRDAEFSGSGCC
jgi:hypothetical protein